MSMDLIQLFKAYAKTGIKTRFQYHLDSFLLSLAVFVREASSIFGVYFLLLKFDTLNDWNIKEIFFMFSILSATYSLFIMFFMVFRDFPDWIKHGDFDRILLRPRGILVQMILNGADWVAALSHGCISILMFILSANSVGIRWNAGSIFYYLVTMISGTMIQGAIFVFFSAFNFYFSKNHGIKEFVFWKSRRFATFPVSIYGGVVQNILMFVIPFAFVNYFPAQYLLRKSDMAAYPEYYMYLSPVIAIVGFTLAYVFWRFSLRYYQS
ncbi:MAG: ABC-2 family transporter protein [Lachnospiraceae bacterium]|nr:ABC-2 family transporter protein [Lachnospiraceae bacterium]